MTARETQLIAESVHGATGELRATQLIAESIYHDLTLDNARVTQLVAEVVWGNPPEQARLHGRRVSLSLGRSLGG